MKENGIVLNFDKVIIAIANADMSVKEFCDKANIYNGTYQRIKKGEWLKTKTISRIAKALNCKVEDLI
ncbi:MAG: helix-turn-helix transcriptional regulator [Erysipelotrichaceae bacterium]|nr:helix-turn-helix transcriptional regulator [Erysipelotrichaceae bacterium]